MTNLDEIKLEPLLGKTKETRILDLIVPLNESRRFTDEQVIKALDSTKEQIKPILKKMVKNGLLIQHSLKTPGVYTVNSQSKQVWAVKNLLVAIYQDLAHSDSMKRLGLEK